MNLEDYLYLILPYHDLSLFPSKKQSYQIIPVVSGLAKAPATNFDILWLQPYHSLCVFNGARTLVVPGIDRKSLLPSGWPLIAFGRKWRRVTLEVEPPCNTLAGNLVGFCVWNMIYSLMSNPAILHDMFESGQQDVNMVKCSLNWNCKKDHGDIHEFTVGITGMTNELWFLGVSCWVWKLVYPANWWGKLMISQWI